ncbi:choline kinase [Paraclostridium bifermentans]|uniref:phosphocholine cytidylyltransferase/choline kinase family protein n=1 Tax=Paraclostridium bifermentans TaxID=1490 RepID=UPI0021C3E9FC|nr:phosphocholine cytidylyltransferase/choline kinase family protein [Paraclostridium bifermentans]GKZ04393.1 choline kinase [Paraclostridium bifermentans]GKZ05238.1 choline kinase [Paraclostridium bifermentans]GKZ11295.1 choline kinase [Paraclostridium bifermentans]
MKEYKILKYINEKKYITQRDISKNLGLSIGNVNSIIKKIEKEKLIEIGKHLNKQEYKLTKKGFGELEKYIKEKKLEKISIHNDENKIIKQAVILAAGEKKVFEKPVAFLDLEEGKLIDRFINILNLNGIEKIVIVTGYKSEYFEEYAKDKNIILVKNDKYKWTGTMHSLSMAKDAIDDDFLLIENDMVFEERAIEQILKDKNRDCMLITSESGSGDEALVEIRDGYIYKMSKDIHQFNKIDGEMIGISKISYEFFGKMLDQFKYNKNPYLNYEYAIMDIARDYKIGYIKPDNLVWTEIDGKEHYKRAIKYIYPKLKRKEQEIKVNNIKKLLTNELNISSELIYTVEPVGGMTNKNFKVSINNEVYILRIPGSGTDEMISRYSEKNNSLVANELNLDTEILYFNEKNGVKLSKYINNAETINPKSAKRESNMYEITNILRKLHTSNAIFINKFDVFEKIEEYELLLKQADGSNFEDYKEIKKKVLNLKNLLDDIGVENVPCHNDTVPENFVKDNERIYLIDWEYSGMNDPMWDVAAHILECEFSENEEELFLNLYFNNNVEEKYRTKIHIYKICQDFLWSIWTNIKEAKGDNFGTYGEDRYNRAKENLKKI